MDTSKSTFLFGATEPPVDVGDENDLIDYFSRRFGIADLAGLADDGFTADFDDDNFAADFDDDEPYDEDDFPSRLSPYLAAAVAAALVRQIDLDDPPTVWATAQRLLATGMERRAVFAQLLAALAAYLHTVVEDEIQSDGAPELLDVHPDRYLAALDALPLPTFDEVEEILITVVANTQGITIADARAAVVEQIGTTSEALDNVIDEVIDAMSDDGGLLILPTDRLVVPRQLFAGSIATHVLTEVDIEFGLILIGPDFAVCAGYSPYGRRLDVSAFTAGDLVAVTAPLLPPPLGERFTDAFTIERVEANPASDPVLGEALQQVFVDKGGDVGLPMGCSELAAAVAVSQPGIFGEILPPLSTSLAAAGLEQRDTSVSSGPNAWRNLRQLRRFAAVVATDALDDKQLATVGMVLQAAGDVEMINELYFRSLCSILDDETSGPIVLDALIDPDGFETDEEEDEIRGFAVNLLQRARRSGEKFWAHWIAMTLDEAVDDPVAAEQHLFAAADAGPTYAMAVDRLGWYASDRGDAAEAARQWRKLGSMGSASGELAVVESFAKPVAQNIGRNEPCWCGSGRKFKTCHLNVVAQPPLPDRVRWLARKAMGYLIRRRGEAEEVLTYLIEVQTPDSTSEDSLVAAAHDPLVFDVALTESGYFEQFISARGALLPPDEAMLAQSWLLVERTVYEVVEVEPGTRMTLRDLRSGALLDVHDRSLSRQVSVGDLWCARAVPDGVAHQLVGGSFPVAPGSETDVLQMLDNGDSVDILTYARDLPRPVSSNRTGR
jgi:SEC-C motif